LCVHSSLFVHLLVIVLTLAFVLSSCQKWIIGLLLLLLLLLLLYTLPRSVHYL
jgi:hypothetical protein